MKLQPCFIFITVISKSFFKHISGSQIQLETTGKGAETTGKLVKTNVKGVETHSVHPLNLGVGGRLSNFGKLPNRKGWKN